VPIAVCSFLADLSPPRLPTLAVAAGAHVYMFQNLRPHAKFTLPPAGGAADEEAVW
jgi:Bardet-Biedl syndrome 1 protein